MIISPDIPVIAINESTEASFELLKILSTLVLILFLPAGFLKPNHPMRLIDRLIIVKLARRITRNKSFLDLAPKFMQVKTGKALKIADRIA